MSDRKTGLLKQPLLTGATSLAALGKKSGPSSIARVETCINIGEEDVMGGQTKTVIHVKRICCSSEVQPTIASFASLGRRPRRAQATASQKTPRSRSLQWWWCCRSLLPRP